MPVVMRDVGKNHRFYQPIQLLSETKLFNFYSIDFAKKLKYRDIVKLVAGYTKKCEKKVLNLYSSIFKKIYLCKYKFSKKIACGRPFSIFSHKNQFSQKIFRKIIDFPRGNK